MRSSCFRRACSGSKAISEAKISHDALRFSKGESSKPTAAAPLKAIRMRSKMPLIASFSGARVALPDIVRLEAVWKEPEHEHAQGIPRDRLP
jgi:hypothetical protein